MGDRESNHAEGCLAQICCTGCIDYGQEHATRAYWGGVPDLCLLFFNASNMNSSLGQDECVVSLNIVYQFTGLCMQGGCLMHNVIMSLLFTFSGYLENGSVLSTSMLLSYINDHSFFFNLVAIIAKSFFGEDLYTAMTAESVVGQISPDGYADSKSPKKRHEQACFGFSVRIIQQ